MRSSGKARGVVWFLVRLLAGACVVVLIAFGLLLIYWFWFVTPPSSEADRKELDGIIVALEAYAKQNNRYPASLADLYPAHLQSFPRLYLSYKASEAGDQCWLVFGPVGGLLSDRGDEYDCAGRKWRTLEYDDLHWGEDRRWRELLQAHSPRAEAR